MKIDPCVRCVENELWDLRNKQAHEQARGIRTDHGDQLDRDVQRVRKLLMFLQQDQKDRAGKLICPPGIHHACPCLLWVD